MFEQVMMPLFSKGLNPSVSGICLFMTFRILCRVYIKVATKMSVVDEISKLISCFNL